MIRTVSVVVAAIGIISSASAQTVLTNPDFDTDLSGWISLNEPYTWTSSDWQNSPTSGSALALPDPGLTEPSVIAQCLPVSQSVPIEASAMFKAGDEPIDTAIELQFFSSTDCAGGPAIDSALIEDYVPSGWDRLAVTALTPQGTQSVSLRISVVLTSLADWGLVDHATLNAGLFGDDFEAGSPTGWAQVVGTVK